ncbi:hypothetical protein [Microbacterium sp.]|jgi:hypothetical protein|uniref:hypothetical protein n=1 Tax=Microbacterium sp. TaxID=51671 RepID=UPI0037CB206C
MPTPTEPHRPPSTPDSYLLLWWLPVGAGGHVVVHTSRWWEGLDAAAHRRPRRPLFHAALELFVDGHRDIIEMAPAWGAPAVDRGVVATGPVGMRALGRSRFFRYEVRCWRDGILPDRAWAVGPPVRLDLSRESARNVSGVVASVPDFVWGRDPLRIGDMWNSNSLASWALTRSGVDASTLHPPDHGRAPGWKSGIAAAAIRSVR